MSSGLARRHTKRGCTLDKCSRSQDDGGLVWDSRRVCTWGRGMGDEAGAFGGFPRFACYARPAHHSALSFVRLNERV